MLQAMQHEMPKRTEGSTTAPTLARPALPLPGASAGAGGLAVAKPEAPPDRPDAAAAQATKKVPETGGPQGPEPTRYGDWERKGRCVDF